MFATLSIYYDDVIFQEDALMDDDFIQRLAALLSQNLDEGKVRY